MNTAKSLAVALANKEMRSKDLAEALGVTQAQISNWKRGQAMKAANLSKICEALEIPVSEFIALGEDK